MDLLDDMIFNIGNKQMEKFASDFFNDEITRLAFNSSPAARSHHQNYRGGLLEHTSNVYYLVQSHPRCTPLALLGALFHDIGKLNCYTFSTFNGKEQVMKTTYCDLFGHFMMGIDIIREFQEKNKILDPDDYSLLLNIIGSHHGPIENGWGSIVDPQTVEATMVHYADLMDSRVEGSVKELKR